MTKQEFILKWHNRIPTEAMDNALGIDDDLVRATVYFVGRERTGKEFCRAYELAIEILKTCSDKTICVATLEQFTEALAKDRCRAIDEFLEMVEKDSAERWVEYHEYGITFNDLERIAKDMKGVKE